MHSYEEIKTTPLGFERIFSLGWTLFRANFVKFLWMALCFNVPLALISEGVTLLSKQKFLIDLGGYAIVSFFILEYGLVFLIALIPLPMTVHLVESEIQGHPAPWTAALRFSLSRLGSFGVTSVMESVILIVLSFFLFIPAVIAGNYYAFAMYAASVRSTGGIGALKYSYHLVNRNWWKVLGNLLLIEVIFGMIVLMIMGPYCVLVYFLARSSQTLILLAIQAAVQFIMGVIVSFRATMIGVFFFNLDYLKNGNAAAAVQEQI